MKLIITVGEALDYSWWERICDVKGIDVWAYKEGLMERGTEITLTQEELLELGILTF